MKNWLLGATMLAGVLAAVPALAQSDFAQPPSMVPISKFLNQDLTNPQGEKLGSLEDVVVDPVQGRIVYGIIEAGGFLGVGDQYIAVPWTLVRPAPQGTGLVVEAARERLMTAPRFDRENWPEMADPKWRQAVATFFGVPADWDTAGAPPPVAAPATTAVPVEVQPVQPAPEVQPPPPESGQTEPLPPDSGQAGSGQTVAPPPDPSGSAQPGMPPPEQPSDAPPPPPNQ